MQKKQPPYLKYVQTSYWSQIDNKDRFEDTLVICIKSQPISLSELLKMDYWAIAYFMFWTERYAAEFDKAEDFFERIANEVLPEYDLGYCCLSGGGGSHEPIMEIDFKRNYVYYKEYRLVMVIEKRFTLVPFGRKKNDEDPQCIYANEKKLRTYEELEAYIREWLAKIKKDTDPCKSDKEGCNHEDKEEKA
ncbi:hypothetical protein [Butyrivibrio sp. XBB1001]|uniref:hypothetical protein n=1 Tax=Butyrivibrio sp. XBB1001 TaxID=1280682 RepID=UPI00040F6BC2|nr:hypothetical protein [Butyrivibrio sp. XBB1001]